MALPPLTVNVERKPNSQVTLRVEASAQQVNDSIAVALRHLAGRVRIPGFRPGKAPAAMVERAVGWEAVKRDATDHLVPEVYRKALEQTGIDPVGEPALELGALDRDQPLQLTATVTVRPEVRLGDYLSIRVQPETAEVSDEQVRQALEEVRRTRAQLRDVDRPAREGDVVRGTLVMRRAGESLSAEDAGERDIELSRDRLLEGIVDGLLGATPGEQRSFELRLPDDYHREELRGTQVSVEARVSAVRERELPPLDDSLAVADGHGTTLEELRAYYRDRLGAAAAEAQRERFESEALGALRDVAQVEIPEVMIEREIEHQLADLEYRLGTLGLPLDRYLEISGQTMEKLRGERREPAVQRVKLELGLDALAEQDGIEVDETQVDREARRLGEGRRLEASQRRRLRDLARRDLRRRAAANRLFEIARSEAPEYLQT